MLQLLKNNKRNIVSVQKLVLDKGGSLVELIIVIGIIVGALGAILGFATFSLVNAGRVQQTSEAIALGEGMLEALRNHRDGVPWNQDTAGTEYDGLGALDFDLQPFHLEKSADTPARWRIVSGVEVINEFTREIQLEKLQRDVNDDIVVSGTLDPETVEVTVIVSWEERGQSYEVRLVEYLTNWQQL